MDPVESATSVAPEAPSPGQERLTFTQWLIVSMAALGFAFDIYVLLVLPLIVVPALGELIKAAPGTSDFNNWRGALFYVPAMVGGLFGMVGGYLTDRLGRRRILVWSILLYAVSALLSGFSTSVGELLFFRCATFVGVCVEFVAAVAWLAELFPNPRRREKVLGYTQAFSSAGGLLAAGTYYLAVQLSQSLPAIPGRHVQDPHAAWRYALIFGVIPAIPLILIRPFLPESPAWKQLAARGGVKRPSPLALFQPAYRRTTLVTATLFACAYGAAFGAIQQLPGIVPGLPGVSSLAKPEQQKVISTVQMWQEVGGLVGRILLALLVVRIASQRKLLRLFQIPGLFLLPLVFLFPARENLELLKWGIFACGLLTVAQFSFWGNYLPRVYPTHLRGTGESFAANIGGRVIGTSAAFLAGMLATKLKDYLPGDIPSTHLAYAAALVGFLAYAIGTVATFMLPEPEKAELPE
jgi:MFS family permease